MCGCGAGLETPRHVLVHYPKESAHREELRRVGRGSLDFRKPLGAPQGAGVTSRWRVRLYQFSLARVLLYE